MLDITPLIDIVFLLLIFFMVMTRFDEEDYKLDVVLPSASEAQPLISQPRELFINISESGEYFVRGAAMTIQQVEQVLCGMPQGEAGHQLDVEEQRVRDRFQHGGLVGVRQSASTFRSTARTAWR